VTEVAPKREAETIPALEKVSLIVPVTTPNASVRHLVEAYARPLRESGYPFEFVFVLDAVPPQIERELALLRGQHPIKIVRLQGGGLGESIALSAGVERADGGYVLNVPQYLQSEPDDVLKVLRALEEGAEFVATWRHPRVDPWLNRLQSRFFNWVLRIAMGTRFHDLNSGLRGMRRHVLEEVAVYGDLYRFLPVLAQRRGFRVVEVKVRHLEEQGRRGFYGIGVYVRRLFDILAITFLTRFTQKPLRFFGMVGLLSIALGLALCADPLLAKFAGGGGIGERPIFILGVILVAFGVQLIGFGLVGEIVIFTQARNLREYKVDELVELEPDAPVPEDPDVVSALVTAGVQAEPAVLPERLRIRELLPGEDARWDSYVLGHPGGALFHLTGWRRIVDEVFRHKPHYLVAERNKRLVGVLPLFEVRSLFTGRSMISTPYAVYGGPLVEQDDPELVAALVGAARELGRECSAALLELRNRVPVQQFGVGTDLYVTFRKELPEDPGAVLPGIPKRARAEVRRARDRYELRCEESGDLAAFYELFARNKRRLGSPSLPLRWFRALFEEFGPRVVLHLVREPDGRALAGVISFCFKDTVAAYYSGARPEANKTGANDFVYCRIMEWAVERGYRLFDFGRSRRDTGPAAFKKNMGFVEEPLAYDYVLLDPDAKPPQFHPSNPRLLLWQRIWSKLPLWFTTKAGGRLSRSLP
jgi:FemAB-related protein (PEP-CTERM system-associated)